MDGLGAEIDKRGDFGEGVDNLKRPWIREPLI